MNFPKNLLPLGTITAGLSLAVTLSANTAAGTTPEVAEDRVMLATARPTPPATRSLNPSTTRRIAADPDEVPMVRTDPGNFIQNARRIIGQDVVTETGQHLGSVEDVAIDVTTGHVEFVAVGPEPMLRVVPPQIFRPQPEEGLLILDIENDQWEDAPTVERNELASLAGEDDARRVYRFYDLEPPGSVARAEPTRRPRDRLFGSPNREPYRDRSDPQQLPGDPALPRAIPRDDVMEAQPEMRRERQPRALEEREQAVAEEQRRQQAEREFGAAEGREERAQPSLRNPRFHHSHRGTRRVPAIGEEPREFGAPARNGAPGTVVPQEERLQWTATLMGQQATDREGRPIGELSDFILDLNRGEVQHVIVTFNEPEPQQYAIPMQDVEIDHHHRVFVRPDPERLQDTSLYDEREGRLQPNQAFRYEEPEDTQFGAPERDPTDNNNL